MEELAGSLDEFQILEATNMTENNVFGDITQLVTTTTRDGNVGPMVGYPTEWASSLGEEREGGSIAERRAATCGFEGFSGTDINIARTFKSICPLSSSPLGVSSSQYITIPAGISPTELLDSPVMLRYSQALPSPTTGSFQLSPLNREIITLDCITPHTIDIERQNDVGSSSMSRLLENNVAFMSGSSMGNKDFGLPVEFPSHVENSNTELSADFEDSKDRIDHLTAQSKSFEDGYNWRKYGQKQVKGSEFPRSYYKCTHPNCLVKKKVERSLEGDVAEIIYKGSHNHSPPQPNPRLIGSSFFDSAGANEPCGEEKEGGGIVWRNIQPKKDQSETLNAFSTAHMNPSRVYEVAGTQELSSKLGTHHEHDGKSLEDEAYLDESESKRRKIDSTYPETTVASRGVREPRVVVQIESEVDILDDGYRWRKYGQKVVKGNPNPRSYYKCTSSGCPVRKHVERACDDFKFVITAYEGKHDHDIPVAKSAAASSTTLSPSTSTNPNGFKTEPQIHRLPDLGNDFMRSAMYGNFNTDMYPLSFPHLQNPMGYNSYGGMSNFPLSLLYDVPRPPLMMPGSVNLYNLTNPVQSSVVGQQPTENELGLIIRPKQERM